MFPPSAPTLPHLYQGKPITLRKLQWTPIRDIDCLTVRATLFSLILDIVVGTQINPRIAAAEYVVLVEEQSRLPSTIDSYTGQDYSNLVRFLKTSAIHRCLTPGSSELYRQGSESENFVWIYELEGDKCPIGVPFSGNSGFGAYDASMSNQLLFLSGYPSPHVLAELGCRYSIDPEFFSRHLSFWRSDPYKTSQILPSTQRTIFQTAFSSIGEHENMSYESFASKRSSFASEMGKYLHKLAMGNGWKSFDSIVRRVHVHDDRYFSIEQMLTILITKNKRNPEKWVGTLFIQS